MQHRDIKTITKTDLKMITMRTVLLMLVLVDGNVGIVDHLGGQCKQYTLHHRKTMDCSHRNLSYVPKTESDIRTLLFSYNYLRNVTSDTFGNISNPGNIVDLELDHNYIQSISANAFDAFPNLKFLYLSNNPLQYDDLKHLLGILSNNQYLSHLSICGIRTITPQKDLFSLMKENRIDTLDARFYNMKTLSMDTFENFNSLETLFLKNNHIEELILSKHNRLHNLYIDHNSLYQFPDFSIKGNESDCYIPNLQLFSIRTNKITELEKDTFKCLFNLKTLELGENPIPVLRSNILSQLPNIDTLQLRFTPSGKLEVEPFAFNSTSLSTLQLEWNSPARTAFTSFSDTFRLTPNLRTLKLGFISMYQLTNEQLSSLFSPLKSINLFECFACEIAQDPEVILKNMNNVVNIGLQSNRITKLSEKTFKNNKHLMYLRLQDNAIGHIPQSALPVSLLKKLHSIDISNNPFVCDCDLEWFINWMKTNRNGTMISNYPQEYICSLPHEKAKRRLSDISFTYKECHPWSPWIWVAIIASPCVIVIGISTLVLYRNRWNIKHYIYLLRKRRNYQIIDGNNFAYDAFVGYEAKDSAWVRRRLLPVLEVEVGLKLCIHERDFEPGVFINDNIVTNMDRSAKIILIVTNSFARSGWCMFELKVAHSKLIEDQTELVVILLEAIDARNMTRSLKLLFETITYIEWTEDIAGQELFWSKLKNVLKK